ncbi:hypothetical protein Q3G72_014562 [Acer saccharum]|nr:hypothetical protein Q3G72_014562 [Acer saccharum]
MYKKQRERPDERPDTAKSDDQDTAKRSLRDPTPTRETMERRMRLTTRERREAIGLDLNHRHETRRHGRNAKSNSRTYVEVDERIIGTAQKMAGSFAAGCGKSVFRLFP